MPSSKYSVPKSAAALTDGGGENRSVDEGEVPFVEEIADCLLDFVADRAIAALARCAEPEVPVVEQEVDAVFLGLDRIVDRARAINHEILHAELESTGSARVRTNLALDFDRSFLGELTEAVHASGVTTI